jgi:hypothetical protein
MISDRHRGLFNSAKEHLEGYPPHYTQVVYTSICHKYLEEATEQGSYRQVEGVVLDLGRLIYMISDRHRGLFNGAKEHLEGYPPHYTQVVYTSICHKYLEEATEQGSYRQVEGVVQG